MGAKADGSSGAAKPQPQPLVCFRRAMAQEAGLPVLFHVGGEEKVDFTYKVNSAACQISRRGCKLYLYYLPQFPLL